MFKIVRGSHVFAKNHRGLQIQGIKRKDWGPDGPKGSECL